MEQGQVSAMLLACAQPSRKCETAARAGFYVTITSEEGTRQKGTIDDFRVVLSILAFE